MGWNWTKSTDTDPWDKEELKFEWYIDNKKIDLESLNGNNPKSNNSQWY